jgi:hypothetical protein
MKGGNRNKQILTEKPYRYKVLTAVAASSQNHEHRKNRKKMTNKKLDVSYYFYIQFS